MLSWKFLNIPSPTSNLVLHELQIKIIHMEAKSIIIQIEMRKSLKMDLFIAAMTSNTTMKTRLQKRLDLIQMTSFYKALINLH
jgi:hypothetical protein